MLLLISLFAAGGVYLAHRHRNPGSSQIESIALAAAGGSGVYLGGRYLQRAFRPPPSTFISHHHGPDGWYKDAVLEYADEGLLPIRDNSVSSPIRSRDPSRIKADLTRRVRESDLLMVVVGCNTHKRAYVRHEIQRAVEADKPIVAVKLNRSHRSPPELLGVGASWAMGPSVESVTRALKKVR